MLLWIGIVTFLVGCALWYRSRRSGARFPARITRLGLGTGALGLGALAMTQPGMFWIISSICFSIVAIVLIGWVLLDTMQG